MLNVMIVEDSDFVRAILRNLLLDIGGIALSGEYVAAPAAISALRVNPPDVVLLDIQLEQGSGMDVMNVVRNEHSDVKVIVVSNSPEEAIRTSYLAAGAYRFYDKSFEIRSLRKKLARLAFPETDVEDIC
ncbi:Response regulator receiver domain-containing protein [Noviherbaspirillum humi]|uniref:Response regulator receiver domain-containing protein n=1 Tax=Noviherbaspirillum humi TaxID=1688639 RepID=A0A239GUN8_9BURK|nr:response regulator [Noviherbaspirillum humi]SNS72946.1 Response regulator receiver domain-containing protein [Noviherbaspirillum humi]